MTNGALNVDTRAGSGAPAAGHDPSETVKAAMSGDSQDRRRPMLASVPALTASDAVSRPTSKPTSIAIPGSLLTIAFRDAPIGMVMTDLRGNVIEVNEQLCQMLGYTDAELQSMSVADLTHADDLAGTRQELGLLLEGRQEASRAHKRVVTKRGQVLWVLRVVSVASDDAGEPMCFIVQIEDVTRERESRDQLSKMAYTDLLTGLGNRATFELNAERLLGQGRVAVLLIDLDDFKGVNDTFGHQAGDQVLAEFARRLRLCAGPADIVVRLGGDEFVVLTPDTDPARLARLSKSILHAASLAIYVGNSLTVVGASVGIAHARAGRGASDLLRRADQALYSAKAAGKGQVLEFDSRHAEAVPSPLADALRAAIAAGTLRVEYQPIYRLADQTLSGFEALCRWSDPTGGVISPDQFIPIAEETGLIHGLGTLVLRRACAEIASLRHGGPPLSVAVNVSVHQLARPEFSSIVRKALSDSGLAPARLTLEITESALSAPGHLDPVLSELRSLGVRLAIDDFGTGYSSMNRFRSSHFHTLKVDRSFVAEITEPVSPAPFTTAAITLGHAQGAVVIAEGIETLTQLQRLRELGCEYGQGYWLSRPLPLDEARRLADTPSSSDLVVAGRPQRSQGGSAPDSATIRELLALLQAAIGLDSAYVTSVDWDKGISRVELSHSTTALDIPEGMEAPWQNSLCRVALLRGTPVLADLADVKAEIGLTMPIETYVTVPLQRPDGSTYGTLCGASNKPVTVGAETLRTFEQFGRMICRFLPGR